LRDDRDLATLLKYDGDAAAKADREAWKTELGAEDRLAVRDRIDVMLSFASG